MSNYQKFPKSEGGLWTNERKAAQNHPGWTGRIKVTRDQMALLVQMGRDGKEPEITVAAWDRKTPDGKQYFYLSGEVKHSTEQAAPPPPPPQPVMSEDFGDLDF